MEAVTAKLAWKLGDAKLAETLVGAGLDTPSKIKRTTNKALLEIEGVGRPELALIRSRFRRK